MASCLCGCGATTEKGKKWIPGHQLRGRAKIESAQQTVPPATDLVSALSAAPTLKVHIYPKFGGEDQGDGGIRRVWEAQCKHLPAFGIQLVDNPEDADVIACHVTTPDSYLKRFPQKPFVSMNHGMYWSEYPEWQNWSLKANADVMESMRVSDAIITCSEWVANAIRRNVSRPVTVIHHGIDTAEWEQLEHKDYVLWNKTRPDPVCDPGPMMALAEMLPDVKFLSTFGEKTRNVMITGKLPFDEAKKLIEQAGVYLCTTRETFGIGTLEALACGVPVVAFKFGGQAEFLEHEVDSYLVTPGDMQSLAEGVEWALHAGPTVAENCRRKAAQFSWEKAAAGYAQVFREAYERKNRPGPRTTIVVTNYNLHDYLTDCLKSVQNQTDEDWECIVVDDASPDPTGKAIAQTFADEDHRFKIIRNEKNVYLAEARNIAIRSAAGRYILPLDADDMLDPDCVALLAEYLDQDKTCHVAYGNVKFVDEDGQTPTIYDPSLKPGHSGWPFHFSFEQQIRQRNLLPYASMYRKEVWEGTGGYRRRCRTAEDADFWTRVSSYGFRPKMVTDRDTLIYRNRPGSMSREQGQVDWVRWFPWSRDKSIIPAGAVTKDQLPVSSLDPIAISVIIPVGPGHEKIVTDAVDSVDAQSFRNWECILINDTGKPLETELPAWVRVLETSGKVGPAAARNAGIKASRGRLFLPLDADDYLEPEALDIMYGAFQRTKSVIYSDFWQTDGEGKNISVHECDDYDPQLITGGKRIVNGETRSGMMHSVTALTPRVYWEQVGGYDENIPAWEDWDFQIALGNIGVCSYRVPAPLFFYRKHTGFRRNENFDSIQRSKEGILRKWGHLWNGDELMACGSCKGQKLTAGGYSSAPWGQSQQLKAPDTTDAVLLQYTGPHQGSTPYRGVSRTTYWFAAGDQKYVLAADVPAFLERGEFVTVEIPPNGGEEPVLVASGQA